MALEASSYVAILSTILGMRIEILGPLQYFLALYCFFRLRHGGVGGGLQGSRSSGVPSCAAVALLGRGQAKSQQLERQNWAKRKRMEAGWMLFFLTWYTVVSMSRRRLLTAEGDGGHGWERYGRRA